MDPQPRGPDWMKISPVAGFLFHEKEQPGEDGKTRTRFSRASCSMIAATR